VPDVADRTDYDRTVRSDGDGADPVDAGDRALPADAPVGRQPQQEAAGRRRRGMRRPRRLAGRLDPQVAIVPPGDDQAAVGCGRYPANHEPAARDQVARPLDASLGAGRRRGAVGARAIPSRREQTEHSDGHHRGSRDGHAPQWYLSYLLRAPTLEKGRTLTGRRHGRTVDEDGFLLDDADVQRARLRAPAGQVH
jgi:hypothetical protein